MITEEQYMKAIKAIDDASKIVLDYSVQTNDLSRVAMQKFIATQTHFQLRDKNVFDVRLYNILKVDFEHIPIHKIDKETFLSAKNAGIKTWKELCEITGNKY